MAVRLDVLRRKSLQRAFAAIFERAQAQTPGIDGTTPAFVLFLADLNGTDHVRHVVNALAFTPGLATNQCLVHLYGPLRSNTVLIRANHAHAQFVQHLERGLIATEPKLALQLQRRHARRLCRHEVRRPEPHLQRRAGRVHHRPCRQ